VEMPIAAKPMTRLMMGWGRPQGADQIVPSHNRSQGSQGASGSVGLWRLRNITRPCLFIFQV